MLTVDVTTNILIMITKQEMARNSEAQLATGYLVFQVVNLWVRMEVHQNVDFEVLLVYLGTLYDFSYHLH